MSEVICRLAKRCEDKGGCPHAVPHEFYRKCQSDCDNLRLSNGLHKKEYGCKTIKAEMEGKKIIPVKCKHYNTQWGNKNFCSHVVGMSECEEKGCCKNCTENCNSRCTYASHIPTTAGEPLKKNSLHLGILPKREIVKVSDITIDGINPRQFVDDESLNDLADSTDVRGFLQPIGVNRFNGTTLLIWGKRRIMAAIRKKKEELEAIVYEGEMSKLDLLLLSLTENIHREPLMRREERNAVNRLHTEHNLSVRDIAKKLKKGKSYVGDLISETKYPEDVLKALDSGLISVKLANKISDIKESDVRAKLIEKGGELYPEDIKSIENTSTEKVEENLNLIKAEKFIKKQMDKLSGLFGNINTDNHADILKEMNTIAEQSYKPLIRYGFMETKSFSEHSEEEVKTILESCEDEDKAVAGKYIELNRHIQKIIEAAENRIKSFQNHAPTESEEKEGDGEDVSDDTTGEISGIESGRYFGSLTEDEVSAGRTEDEIVEDGEMSTDEICDELTHILGFKTVYKGEIRDGETPEIHLVMNNEDILKLHKKLTDIHLSRYVNEMKLNET